MGKILQVEKKKEVKNPLADDDLSIYTLVLFTNWNPSLLISVNKNFFVCDTFKTAEQIVPYYAKL